MGTVSSSGKAATPHFETVISAVKVAGLQRVGTLSNLGEFAIYQWEIVSDVINAP